MQPEERQLHAFLHFSAESAERRLPRDRSGNLARHLAHRTAPLEAVPYFLRPSHTGSAIAVTSTQTRTLFVWRSNQDNTVVFASVDNTSGAITNPVSTGYSMQGDSAVAFWNGTLYIFFTSTDTYQDGFAVYCHIIPFDESTGKGTGGSLATVGCNHPAEMYPHGLIGRPSAAANGTGVWCNRVDATLPNMFLTTFFQFGLSLPSWTLVTSRISLIGTPTIAILPAGPAVGFCYTGNDFAYAYWQPDQWNFNWNSSGNPNPFTIPGVFTQQDPTWVAAADGSSVYVTDSRMKMYQVDPTLTTVKQQWQVPGTADRPVALLCR